MSELLQQSRSRILYLCSSRVFPNCALTTMPRAQPSNPDSLPSDQPVKHPVQNSPTSSPALIPCTYAITPTLPRPTVLRPTRLNPLYSHLSGPRLPSSQPSLHSSISRRCSAPQTSSRAMQQSDNGSESPSRPVDIRARVAAFERMGSNPSTSSPLLLDGTAISRVSSVPKSRQDHTTATNVPLAQSHPEDPMAEFGRLPSRSSVTQNLASVHSLPLPSSSSASSLATNGSPSLRGSSPAYASTFDALARSPRKVGSGTSLKDFTEASLPRIKQGGTAIRSIGTSSLSVSGKVPLPTSANAVSPSRRGSSPRHSGSEGTSSGRASPALPPRPQPNQTACPPATAKPPWLEQIPQTRHMTSSSTSSSTSASSSRHPLDDPDEVNYSLSLHPTLQPAASPVSSRTPSRNSARSAPSSPSFRARLGLPNAELRLHPPTPSPERRGSSSHAAPELPPRRPSVDSDTNSSGAPSSLTPRPQPPALPPRLATAAGQSEALHYTPYRSKTASVIPHVPNVASKVPPPPSFAAFTPANQASALSRTAPALAPIVPPDHAHFVRRHTPSASTGSSPLASPASIGHRSTRSGPSLDSPIVGAGNALSSSQAPVSILPPPSRSRALSVGPSVHTGRKEVPRASPNLFGGSQVYRMGAKTGSPARPVAQSGNLASRPLRSLAPRDEDTRRMYEALWDRELDRLAKRRRQLRGAEGLSSAPLRMSPKTVRRIWSRSRLPFPVLAKIWAAAVSFDRDGEAVLSPSKEEAAQSPNDHKDKTRRHPGLSKEAFVRGISAIDAELAWRIERKRARSERPWIEPSSPAGARRSPMMGLGAAKMNSPGVRSASSPTNSFKTSSTGFHPETDGRAHDDISVVKRKVPPPPAAVT